MLSFSQWYQLLSANNLLTDLLTVLSKSPTRFSVPTCSLFPISPTNNVNNGSASCNKHWQPIRTPCNTRWRSITSWRNNIRNCTCIYERYSLRTSSFRRRCLLDDPMLSRRAILGLLSSLLERYSVCWVRKRKRLLLNRLKEVIGISWSWSRIVVVRIIGTMKRKRSIGSFRSCLTSRSESNRRCYCNERKKIRVASARTNVWYSFRANWTVCLSSSKTCSIFRQPGKHSASFMSM